MIGKLDPWVLGTALLSETGEPDPLDRALGLSQWRLAGLSQPRMVALLFPRMGGLEGDGDNKLIITLNKDRKQTKYGHKRETHDTMTQD